MYQAKITPLYERLSRDDELQRDSNSIVSFNSILLNSVLFILVLLHFSSRKSVLSVYRSLVFRFPKVLNFVYEEHIV